MTDDDGGGRNGGHVRPRQLSEECLPIDDDDSDVRQNSDIRRADRSGVVAPEAALHTFRADAL